MRSLAQSFGKYSRSKLVEHVVDQPTVRNSPAGSGALGDDLLAQRYDPRAQSLFPWLVLGADFDNDSAFMNEVVVPWRRAQKIEVTRSRAYKKNDQAFVEQKNGAVVRRLDPAAARDGYVVGQRV